MGNCPSEAINEDEASTVSSVTTSQTNLNAPLADLHASLLIEETTYHRINNIPEKTVILQLI